MTKNTMIFDIQRLRNLTTGRLHTDIGHVYEDLEKIIGDRIMTHMIPRVIRSVEPWLRNNVTDDHFWDGEFDQTRTGKIELPVPTEEEQNDMFERFKTQPNPLDGKDVIMVKIQ